MNLYKIHPQEDYLSIVADFILDNFPNLYDLKVILPSGYACFSLQQILILKKQITILPNIVPFNDLTTEREEIFTIPTENIDILKCLEEKIILAEIINSYKKLEFNICQSLKFASNLGNLFHDLNLNNISIESIKHLPTVNNAEHWQFIYDFLYYAYKKWQQEITSLKKVDKTTFQRNIYEAEVRRIKNNPQEYIIIAGIWGSNKLSWEFLKEIISIESTFFILPPIPDFSYKAIKEYEFDSQSPLFCLNQLLKILRKDLSDFRSLGKSYNVENLDGLLAPELVPTLKNTFNYNFQYKELEDIFQEADYISKICHQSKNKKIALILPNENNKNIYINFLKKFSLKFDDLLGKEFTKTHILHFIFSISEIICSEFNLVKFLILLKNPILPFSEEVLKFQRLFTNTNRFVSGYEDILIILEKNGNNNLKEWFLKFDLLFNNKKHTDFKDLLKIIIQIAEKLYPEIWSPNYAFGEEAELLAELLNLKVQPTLNNIEDFPQILKSLVSGARFFDQNKNTSSLAICRAEEVIFLKFDLIILADFSEGNWPKQVPGSPWLNKQMQTELNLYSSDIKLSTSLYNFYLILNNNNVVITRSKRQGNNTWLLSSSYILKLQYILQNSLISSFNNIGESRKENHSFIPDKKTVIKTNIAVNIIFPRKLYATDIEMLVRSPYSFYAKKILGLKNLDNIASSPKLSEFGNFIHNIFEIYTKSYNKNEKHKLKNILKISEDSLNDLFLPVSTRNFWKLKFAAIADEFIEFDEGRRAETDEILSEVEGEMKMTINGQDININAFADIIEVNYTNKSAVIMDYKTGSIPTKQEVLGGLSPQLIIEALICLYGGFGIPINNIEKLIYVKISSSKPYIQTSEMRLTFDELMRHQQGLIKLLKYYISNQFFNQEIDLLKYNNYRHLARVQ